MKKDILVLCQYFFPEFISSAKYPYDTAKALSGAGFKVDVLCGYPNEYNNEVSVPLKEKHGEIEIIRLKYLQVRRIKKIGRLVNYFSFTLVVLFRLKKFKQYKSVIVYSNPPILPLVACIAKKFYGVKIIFVSFDVYPEIAIKTNSIKEIGIISKIMQHINNDLFRVVDKVVAISTEMKDFLLNNRNHLHEQQVVVIPNWFENKQIKDVEESYANHGFKAIKAKEKLVISYFGNMGIAQDLNTLIEAIKTLKYDDEVVFIFAGHGKKLLYLKETVINERLTNVFIYDYLHGEYFQDALNISDVFIVSLEKGLLGLAVPSKTYSYISAGKPVITIMDKNSELSKEIVNNEAGYGIEIGDVDTIVSLIRYLKRNKEKMIEMGKNARKLFEEKYTLEKSTAKYVEMMNSVLGDY